MNPVEIASSVLTVMFVQFTSTDASVAQTIPVFNSRTLAPHVVWIVIQLLFATICADVLASVTGHPGFTVELPTTYFFFGDI
jgi:hypothetical protein